MLTKRCETLSHAAEVESKKTKREIAVLEKEVAALKADITSKEKEAKVTEPREVTLFREQWMRRVICWSASSCRCFLKGGLTWPRCSEEIAPFGCDFGFAKFACSECLRCARREWEGAVYVMQGMH
jgi:hypothetical protein